MIRSGRLSSYRANPVAGRALPPRSGAGRPTARLRERRRPHRRRTAAGPEPRLVVLTDGHDDPGQWPTLGWRTEGICPRSQLNARARGSAVRRAPRTGRLPPDPSPPRLRIAAGPGSERSRLRNSPSAAPRPLLVKQGTGISPAPRLHLTRPSPRLPRQAPVPQRITSQRPDRDDGVALELELPGSRPRSSRRSCRPRTARSPPCSRYGRSCSPCLRRALHDQRTGLCRQLGVETRLLNLHSSSGRRPPCRPCSQQGLPADRERPQGIPTTAARTIHPPDPCPVERPPDRLSANPARMLSPPAASLIPSCSQPLSVRSTMVPGTHAGKSLVPW